MNRVYEVANDNNSDDNVLRMGWLRPPTTLIVSLSTPHSCHNPRIAIVGQVHGIASDMY